MLEVILRGDLFENVKNSSNTFTNILSCSLKHKLGQNHNGFLKYDWIKMSQQ
jgi:hypothetical protein